MIPAELRALVERQPGNVRRAADQRQDVIDELHRLGVPLNSELGEFFLDYVITYFRSIVSNEELCDLLLPTAEIRAGTAFVREVWQLPDRYVCLTSCQGEGAYLYDTKSSAVVDFSLERREDIVNGTLHLSWPSFFEFLYWYLTTPSA